VCAVLLRVVERGGVVLQGKVETDEVHFIFTRRRRRPSG
jgi:hypothetical protein